MNEKEFFVSVSSDKSTQGTIQKYETRSQKVIWAKKDECYHGLTMSSENYLAAFSRPPGNRMHSIVKIWDYRMMRDTLDAMSIWEKDFGAECHEDSLKISYKRFKNVKS